MKCNDCKNKMKEKTELGICKKCWSKRMIITYGTDNMSEISEIERMPNE